MSKDMSISDLLPLVAVALNDKAAADAAKELATALEERDLSRRVEVLRALNDDDGEDGEIIVYGYGLFEEGQYGNNTNLWDVTLKPSSNNVCRLADLRKCQICVGGGFPVASLDDTFANNPLFEGWISGEEEEEEEEEETSTGDTCEVSFCFCPCSTWLVLSIHGWPREEWEAVIQANDIDPDDVLPFLVEDVAAQYPDATVEFKVISFVAKEIHGALKRLLPSKRKEEVRADREARIANKDYREVIEFVARTMRERGNDTHASLFMPQLYSIVDFLSLMRIKELGGNVELIMTAIDVHAQHGAEGLRELFDRHRPDRMDEDEGNEDVDEGV
jgi:hypothetical protein